MTAQLLSQPGAPDRSGGAAAQDPGQSGWLGRCSRRLGRPSLATLLLGSLLLLGSVHPSALVTPAEAAEADETASAKLLALTTYVYPQVVASANDAQPWCLSDNPSCARDPWFGEWNEPQQADLVQYQFVGPGLATERRFAEAVRLLWQWPEGRFLLSEAAAHGVAIVTFPDSLSGPAYAAYIPQFRAMYVNRRFTTSPTWMVAAVLGHELKHAADHRGGTRQELDFEDCIAREQVAYQVEARYLQWLAARFQGFPARDLPLERLSLDDRMLYLNLHDVATSPDVDADAFSDYREHCAVFS